MRFNQYCFQPITPFNLINKVTPRRIFLHPHHIYLQRLMQGDGDILEENYAAYLNYLKCKREQWAKIPDLLKIIILLRKAFIANLNAHSNLTVESIFRNYSEKENLIRHASYYAKYIDSQINPPCFTWGIQEDVNLTNYPFIIYFQLQSRGQKIQQVSFHLRERLRDSPNFEGKWNGVHQEQFPFAESEIKAICAANEVLWEGHDFPFKQLDASFATIQKYITTERNKCREGARKEHLPQFEQRDLEIYLKKVF